MLVKGGPGTEQATFTEYDDVHWRIYDPLYMRVYTTKKYNIKFRVAVVKALLLLIHAIFVITELNDHTVMPSFKGTGS